MENDQEYQSVPIPQRGQMIDKQKALETALAQIEKQFGKGAVMKLGQSAVVSFDDDPFAEVEISASSTAPVSPVPQAETVAPAAADEKRALFYEMRQIGRSNDFSFQGNHSKAFYRQAQFMKDFEDDYEGNAAFTAYFPYYQLMGYGQLRTYFTWRTRVRNGSIGPTSLSYAFLYIYELINNVGVESPQEGLDKLLAFWRAYRAYDAVIDKYALPWLKDYHVYYQLPQAFRAFAAEQRLQKYYPAVFGYGSGREDSFDLFADISKYDIQQSVFYSEEAALLIADCFYFVLTRLRSLFKGKKRGFEDFVFYPIARESVWTPFGSALFFPWLKQLDRQVTLSERETYTCRDNKWTYKTVILTERGRQFVGYVMKETEAALRKATGFKYKLSANPNLCGGRILRRFETMKVSLPDFIQKSVAEFYTIYTRKIVSVDNANLTRIREEALQTQEKLIVPEMIDIVIEEAKPVPVEIPAPAPVSEGWAAFRQMLTPMELEALRAILRGQDIKAFTAKNNIMPEVLVDGINQKAVDCVGDAVLELDGAAAVYEEYKDKLTEMVTGGFEK